MRMTTADSNAVLGSVQWTEEALYLKEFVHKHANSSGLPRLIRIVKGQYLGVGAPSLSNPSSSQTLLLMSLGKRKRLLAQCVKFKEASSSAASSSVASTRKVTMTGPKLAIPATYDGYFEILSEDGRSVRCIESVAELSKRFPDSVLVRENIRAYVSKSDDIDTIKDKARLIGEGESLILVGETLGTKGKTQSRFLRCLDENGENVYLPMELKGKFSALAKEDNISGVHTARNLLEGKRLPVMARLAHGTAPTAVKSFTHEMRMVSAVDEEFLVGLSLGSKDCQLVPLPLPAVLKVQTAANHGQVKAMPEFERLTERGAEMAADIADRITVHEVPHAKTPAHDKAGGGGSNNNNVTATYQRRKSRNKSYSTSLFEHQHYAAAAAPSTRNSDEYDEIEQIYDYVRGFAPLPRSAKGWRYENAPQKHAEKEASQAHNGNKGSASPSSDQPPEPPPIETIPTIMRNQQHSPMDYATPPTTPPISAVWDVQMNPDFTPGGVYEIGLAKAAAGSNKEAKKRQRRATAADENVYPPGAVPGLMTAAATPAGVLAGSSATARFIKSASAATHRQIGQKHKFFRQRFGNSKQQLAETPPLMSMTLSRSNLYSPVPGTLTGHSKSSPSPASFFHLRYKSLTNLATAAAGPHHPMHHHGELYDTLESSNSGGKTSGGGDSGGSRTLPEKRSRRLSRPKSLTNLVWGSPSGTPSGSGQSSGGPPSVGERGEKGLYGRPQPTNLLMGVSHHSNKMGSTSSKKIGTLYL